MVGNFSFMHSPTIIFGIGSRTKLRKKILNFGDQIILLTGKSSFAKNRIGVELINLLVGSGIKITKVSISSEPSPKDIDQIVERNKNQRVDCVVAIGGGSVMDAGKAVSAMLTVQGSVKDYLEGVGRFNHPGTKIPFIAMPTTAGTGSEATKNAVITELGDYGYKKSLRHDNFVPEFAIVDPELMLSCSVEITAAGGMDAFTQLVESYLSTKSTPITDALALNGIAYVINSLEKAVADGTNLEAREGMAYAALLSGMTLANAGLGVVHGFAQPLGSLFSVPHGVVCGTLMPSANRVTIKKLLDTHESSIAITKYAKLGELIGSTSTDKKTSSLQFLYYLETLSEKLAIPCLSNYGVQEADLDKIVAVSELKNHPVVLDSEELYTILKDRL